MKFDEGLVIDRNADICYKTFLRKAIVGAEPGNFLTRFFFSCCNDQGDEIHC